MLAFDNHGYLFIGVGDGGGTRRPEQQRPERQRRCSARSCGSTSTARPAASSTGSRGTIRTSAGPVATRSGRSACATRGASRSIAPRTTCGSATSDRRSYEEIDRATSASSGYGRGINFGWRVMEGRHCYRPSSGCNTSGKRLPVVEYTPRRRLRGHRRLRLSRDSRPVAVRPLRLRRLLLGHGSGRCPRAACPDRRSRC